MRTFTYLLLGLIAFVYIRPTMSQTSVQPDWEVWLEAGMQYNPGKRWQFSGGQQVRFDKIASELKNFHTELKVEYSVNDLLEIRVTGRHITRNDNMGKQQGLEPHFRYQLGFTLRHDWSALAFAHRLVYQHKHEIGVTQQEGDIPERFLRWRSGFTYKIKNWKYDPELDAEYFHSLNGPASGLPHSLRLTLGTEREMGKIGELGIQYRYETSLGPGVQEVVHILALRYTYVMR